MQTYGTPNKYIIFQNFYLRENGVKISYNDAVRLFYSMDSATESKFITYYEDQVGYEIAVPGLTPYVGAESGFNLDEKFEIPTKIGEKNVNKKVQMPDGSYVYKSHDADGNPFKKAIWTNSYNTAVFQNGLHNKYTLAAHLKMSGLDADIASEWLIYSAEEIINMENNGVNIPKQVLDYAHSIYESQGPSYEVTPNENDASDDSEQTTEREPFLELIPKTEKHIEKCNEKQEKIEDKIDDMLDQSKHDTKTFFNKQKTQLDELEEFEEQIRVWRKLQDKINNGEELTDSEARKYAEITGMLQDRNNSDEFKLNKNKIAADLNEINILAILGEKLAEETVEMGETLADYTSKHNYKTTRAQVTGEVGFLRAITAMVHGKAVAKQAVETGNDVKGFTDEVSKSMFNIAQILGVKQMLINPAKGETSENSEPSGVKVAENEELQGTDNDKSNQVNKDDNTEQSETAQADGALQATEEAKEDLIVNDDTVLQLIDETKKIHPELAKEIVDAVLAIKDAKSDEIYSAKVEKFINKMVAEYQQEEAQRQELILANEEENKQLQDEIDEMTGSDNNEQAQIMKNAGVEADDEQSKGDKKEIEAKKQQITQNNSDIEAINLETQKAIAQFKETTSSERKQISERVPNETENLERDTKYVEEIIPEYSQKLTLTESTGGTLFKMGKYRIVYGMSLLYPLSPRYYEGLMHIAKGTKSSVIGASAKIVGAIPTDDVAMKAAIESTEKESESLNELNSVDANIISVTGEESQEDKSEKSADSGTGQQDIPEMNDEEGKTTGAAANVVKNDEKSSDTNEKEGAGTIKTVSLVQTNVKTQFSQANTNDRRFVKGREEKTHYDIPEASPLAVNGNTKKKNDDKNMSTDDAKGSVSDIKASAKDSSKDSEKVLKDTDKDEKQLRKESKQLQKQMKTDEKEIIKMTKESMGAAKKQAEIILRYEQLVAENDKIVAEETQKQVSAPSAVTQVAQNNNFNVSVQNTQPTDSSQGTTADNAQKLQNNDNEITVLGAQFNMYGKKIDRNRAKTLRLSKRTKVTYKKVQKKDKIINTKIKEAEQKEVEKQKKLAKQLGTVGIAENIFSITAATGAAMMLFPPTASAGSILFKIGTYGIILCGLTKAGINLANDNLTAALMGLGQTLVTAAASMVGASGASSAVMTAVSSGLQVVSSSAELVNNVRAVQGKEADSTFSKIGTIAGIASSVASAGAGLSNLKSGDSFGKVAGAVGNAVGTGLSAASQIMNEFGLGNEDLAGILSMVGGSISMASSIATMAANKKENADNLNNNDKKEDIKNNTEDNKPNTQSKREGNLKEQIQPDQEISDYDQVSSNSPEATKTEPINETEAAKKWEAFMNGASFNEAFNNRNNAIPENYVELAPKMIDQTTLNNENQINALQAANNNEQHNNILETLKEMEPANVGTLSDAEMKKKLNDTSKLDAIAEKIQADQLAQYKSELAKQSKNEKMSKIIETSGNVLQSVAGLAEMGIFGSSDEEEAAAKKYASNGKELLGSPYQNAKRFRESREEDYRKKVKKQQRRINAANGARSVA